MYFLLGPFFFGPDLCLVCMCICGSFVSPVRPVLCVCVYEDVLTVV
jgi:hypothetical protein